MRMRIESTRGAMCGPSGMCNADMCGKRAIVLEAMLANVVDGFLQFFNRTYGFDHDYIGWGLAVYG